MYSNDAPIEAQLQRAKELIQAKRYDDARSLLITVDHPTADKWLARLNNMPTQLLQVPLPSAKYPTVRQQISATAHNSGRNQTVALQALDDQIASEQSQKNAATIVFLFCLLLSPLGIGIILLPFSLFNYFRHKDKLNKLKEQRLRILGAQ